MAGDLLAFIFKTGLAEDRVAARKIADNGARQRGDIACRRHMTHRRQPRGVEKCGAGHAEPSRCLGHPRGELAFAARDIFGERHGEIIGGFGGDDAHRLANADLRAGFQPQPGRRLAGSGRRDADHVTFADIAVAQFLEGDIQRHHLGDRRRIAWRIGLPGIKHFAIGAVDQDRRIFGHGVKAGRPGRCSKHEAGKQRRKDPQSCDCLDAQCWIPVAA